MIKKITLTITIAVSVMIAADTIAWFGFKTGVLWRAYINYDASQSINTDNRSSQDGLISYDELTEERKRRLDQSTLESMKNESSNRSDDRNHKETTNIELQLNQFRDSLGRDITQSDLSNLPVPIKQFVFQRFIESHDESYDFSKLPDYQIEVIIRRLNGNWIQSDPNAKGPAELPHFSDWSNSSTKSTEKE